MSCDITHFANIVYFKLKRSFFKWYFSVSHIILLKIKSLFHKFRAPLTVHISPWSIKFRPSSEFIIANRYLCLPRMIILLRKFMVLCVNLTNSDRISSISSPLYISVSILALHQSNKIRSA